MNAVPRTRLTEDRRSSHFTKIVLVTWLVFVGWNSEKVFRPVELVPVDQIQQPAELSPPALHAK